jgi:hypothetical protein
MRGRCIHKRQAARGRSLVGIVAGHARQRLPRAADCLPLVRGADAIEHVAQRDCERHRANLVGIVHCLSRRARRFRERSTSLSLMVM